MKTLLLILLAGVDRKEKGGRGQLIELRAGTVITVLSSISLSVGKNAPVTEPYLLIAVVKKYSPVKA